MVCKLEIYYIKDLSKVDDVADITLSKLKLIGE
jgi:hypothetical protein